MVLLHPTAVVQYLTGHEGHDSSERMLDLARMSFVLLLLFCMAGCAAPPVAPVLDLHFEEKIEVAGAGRNRLFDLTRLWLERHLYSKERIIELADRESGVIVANGEMDYPAVGLEEMERIQYTISFRVSVEVSSGRLGLLFDDFLINVPKNYDRRAEFWLGREYFGGYSRPPVSMEECRAAQKGISGIVERLRSYLSPSPGATRRPLPHGEGNTMIPSE